MRTCENIKSVPITQSRLTAIITSLIFINERKWEVPRSKFVMSSADDSAVKKKKKNGERRLSETHSVYNTMD